MLLFPINPSFSRWARTKKADFDSSVKDLLQPDGQAEFSTHYIYNTGILYDISMSYKQQYGRIQFRSDSGADSRPDDSKLVVVNDDEVLLNINVTSGTHNLTLYAVRRFKIQSHTVDSSVALTPMQPNSQRSKTHPLDFSCTEFDLSALPSGAKRAAFISCMFRFASNPFPGSRAVLTVTSSGGFDNASSTMTYSYSSSHELYGPAQYSNCSVGSSIDPYSAGQNWDGLNRLPKCSDYYVDGLYRQHSKPALFRDFPSQLGRAYLVNSPGYYVACVSAGTGAVQGGVLMLRYMRKDVKDMSGCPAAHAGQPSYNPSGTSMPS
jgi:predicted heme/steroid binding protein